MIVRRGVLGAAPFNPLNLQTNASGATATAHGDQLIKNAGDNPDIIGHSIPEIFEESMGNVPGGFLNETEAASTARAAFYQEKIRTLGVNLEPCPDGAVTNNGAGCYGAAVDLAFTQTNDINDPWGLVMPGTIVFSGVPIALNNIVDGKLTRVFIPDDLQRKQLEIEVIRGSLNYFFDDPNSALNPVRRLIVGTSGLIYDSIKLFLTTSLGRYPSSDDIQQFAANASVDDMMQVCTDIRLSLVNFVRNPNQPTGDQLSTAGGWSRWIADGGYPLSNAVAHAQAPIETGIGLGACASALCRCPTTGRPSCQPAYLTKDGLAAPGSGADNGGSWTAYVAIHQGDAYWELSLVHQDPSWIAKVGNQLAEWMQDLGNLFCSSVDKIQHQNAQVQAPVCTDPTGKPCLSGTVGCTCRQPPNASTASVANTNIYAKLAVTTGGAFCSGWESENQPPPVYPDPSPQYPTGLPPNPFVLSPLGWFAVVVLGVGAGVLLSRR